VCFHYPPDISANPYPTSSWAKYLGQVGWKPIVLTSQVAEGDCIEEIDSIPVYRVRHDQSFEKLVALRSKLVKQSVLFKVLNFFLFNFLLYPDEKRGWFKDAYKKGLLIIRKEKIGLILSIGTPWTDHWISSRLNKRTGIPWIADYRDPWTQRTSMGFRPKWIFQMAVSRLLERRMLGSASCCIHASKIWANQLRTMMSRKVFSIPNGYEPEDFQKNCKYRTDGKMFTISYVGTLHFLQELTVFMEGFERFLSDSKTFVDRCRLNFIGSGDLNIIDRKFKLVREVARFFPYVSKHEAIKFMRISHVLLLFLSGDTGWYPTKLFEYLASGRPILASPDNGGVVTDLLKCTSSGVVLDSPEKVTEWMERRFSEFRENGTLKYCGKSEIISKFHRVRLTENLSYILDRYLDHE